MACARVSWLAAFLFPFLALTAHGQEATPEDTRSAGAEEAFSFVLGGEAVLTLDAAPTSPGASGGRSLFTPRAVLTSGPFELVATLEASVDSLSGATADISELAARFTLADWGIAEIGRFLYKPGAALFFSNVEYFTSLDFARLLTEGPDAPGRPDDMAQLRILGDWWHASVTFSPWRPAPDPLPTASPWFPRGGIQDSFVILTTTYVLRSLAWQEGQGTPWPVPDPAFSVEAGVVLGPLDLSFSYFDGPDRQSAVTGFITLPVNPFGVYDITLQEQSSRISREGLAASLQTGPVKAWIDGSLFQGRLFTTGDLYSAAGGWLTGTRAADGLDLTIGLSYNPPLPNSLLGIECRYAWYAGDTSGMSFPLLHRVLAAIVSFSLFKETLGIGVVGLLSLSDWSWGILPSLSISLGDERTLQIWLPRFFGNRTAELGQFAGLDMFMTALRLRF